MNNTIISLKNIGTTYKKVQCLKGVNLDIESGKIYSLFGEHSSGKTSLCRVLSGLEPISYGEIILNGNTLPTYNYNRAMKGGIYFVDQDVFLTENLTINDYFLLNSTGFSKHPFNFISYSKKKLGKLFCDYDLDIDLNTPISQLSLEDKALISILHKIFQNPKILILDESIEKLSNKSRDVIFEELKKMTEKGSSVILATHNTSDVYDLSDVLIIMRNKEIVFLEPAGNIDELSLLRIAYARALRNSERDESNYEFYNMLKFNQAIIEKLPITLIQTDNELNIKSTNKFALDMFKRTSFKNETLNSLFIDNPIQLKNIIEGLRTEEMVSQIGINFKLYDENRFLNIISYPVFDRKFLLGYSLIISDVTEQEFLRDQIIVSEKMGSVGLLAAGIAHEINNPLEIIINCLDSLRIHSINNPKEHFFGYIEEEIERISDIISNLVSYSSSNTDITNVHIPELIYDVTELIRPYATKHNTTISVHSSNLHKNVDDSAESFHAEISNAELKQVLLNVTKNAIDSIEDESGSLLIEASLVIGDGSQIVRITIDDTGRGIDEEDLAKVFMPFYTKNKDEGTGLGLYISYQILAKYNGQIHFEAKEKGTKCVIEIPACV